MKKRRRILFAFLLLAATASGATGWWWHHSSRADYRLRLGQQLLRLGQKTKESWPETFQQSQELLRNGDQTSESRTRSLQGMFAYQGWPPAGIREKVERLAVLLEAERPSHANLLRGQLFFREGRFDLALAELNEVPRDGGELDLQAAVFAGRCLIAFKDFRRAAAALNYAAKNWPASLDPHRGLIEAHRGLAVIYWDLGAMDMAIHHAEEIARQDQSDWRALRLMGMVYNESLWQYSKAGELYEEALRRRPPPQWEEIIKDEYAEVLIKQGQHDQALKILEDVSPLAHVQALRAECLWAQGKIPEARDLLEKALSVDRRCQKALQLLAKLQLEELAKPQDAVPLLQQALQIDPKDYVSRDLLAQAYGKLGRRAEAQEQRRLYEEAHQFVKEMAALNREAMEKPWDAAVRLRLAELCRKNHRPDLAGMWQESAQECLAGERGAKK